MVSIHAILVANASLARLFLRSSSLQPWVEIQDWWHAEGRMHARDLARSSLGHSLEGRTSLAPHTEIRHHERAVFARELAQGLDQSMTLDQWQRLEIFASNPFLGELLAQLGSQVQKRVCAAHPLDWTALSPQEIEFRWKKDFMI